MLASEKSDSPTLRSRLWARLGCVVGGLLLALLQIGLALMICPLEGPVGYRYSTLIQHDSYWFENIAAFGYNSTVPPTNHKMMSISNVAFFPAYPSAGRMLAKVLDIDVGTALLITAQVAAWGFWTYLLLFFKEWELSFLSRLFGVLAILAHPAAFFLVAAYSESLFLMALFGFLYWTNRKGKLATVLALGHGFGMSATRIVGVVCAGYPAIRSIALTGLGGLSRPWVFLSQHARAFALSALATLGTASFFFYCQWRWGCWNLYMLTQESGWAVEADYLAVFRPSSYHWLIPELEDPQEMSQLVMTLAGILFLVLAIGELLPALRRKTRWRERLGFYFCAGAIYYISVSGVASVDMESMLRYELCTHALLVLAVLHYLEDFRSAPVLVQAFGMAIAGVATAAGLALQAWYTWNFMQGNWVA